MEEIEDQQSQFDFDTALKAYTITIFVIYLGGKAMAWATGSAGPTTVHLSYFLLGGMILVLVGLVTGRLEWG